MNHHRHCPGSAIVLVDGDPLYFLDDSEAFVWAQAGQIALIVALHGEDNLVFVRGSFWLMYLASVDPNSRRLVAP